MIDAMLRMDWTTRHRYVRLVINSHTRRHQTALIRMLEDHMCSADWYFGQNDCRPPLTDVIRLHDRPRGRQLRLPDMFARHRQRRVGAFVTWRQLTLPQVFARQRHRQ